MTLAFPHKLMMESVLPQTGPEGERREEEKTGWRADGREGREKGRKEKH